MGDKMALFKTVSISQTNTLVFYEGFSVHTAHCRIALPVQANRS